MPFEVILTPDQIEALYDLAYTYPSEYAEGIRAAIDYLTGRTKDNPLE